ncbi:MAG: complex I NDUFA9 subunit family protein, partial [Alphaproteobacteria bacterium]|nr:complex I NDUFA9 subunit family protein [Alphaproteobacteria bacterium]
MRNVTVFGGSGFLGRYLISRLVKGGDRVRAAVRDPAAASHLLPLGDVGQVQPVQANIRNAASVRRAVGGADVVVNLVGLLYQRGAQSFQAVHEDGAATIAAVAAEAGASRLLQVSAIGAAADATSAYGRSKAAGEAAVREHFPGATIVRPSIVFGPEDGFFNLFGMLASLSPVLPLIGGGHTRFPPVFVGDGADGID